MRMLIIDDSSTMRGLLAAIAAELGVGSEQAADGRVALEVLERHPSFELALVDWDMPRMNGLEFVRAVRARPEFSSLKLMMVTSHNAIEDVEVALASGADDFLMKPLDAEMVAEKLQVLGLL
ncbi:MAG TPA: response regulator [Bryobacteraceae bacterium]|nr:response regulator [Bryobacteraceae bacterium]